MPIVAASRELLVGVTIFPAAEKALSHSAYIGWIVRKSIAILDKRG
jgi:hypothetical protein